MSSDTAKENASIVDSSVTELKQDMGNSDDPESSSFRGSENGDPLREKELGQIRDLVENSTASKRGRLYDTRYFIIKSLNHQNLQLSVEKGIWATQVMNEPILEDAFHNSGRVLLIFSVNMSGFFQGYAQMISSVGWRRDNVWSQGNGKCNPWGRSFKVKWLQLNDLPFQKTLHLKNPLNDFKPVKISRDCQELSPEIGEALCELLDGQINGDGTHIRDDYASKRPCIETPCSLGDEDYNVGLGPSPVHPSWAHYPSVYQQQSEAVRYQLAHGRNSESPRASVLTDDDFLEMSYEEYLEAHSRSSNQLNHLASGPSRAKQDSSRRKTHEEDLSNPIIGRSSRNDDRFNKSSRKRTHNSSQQ